MNPSYVLRNADSVFSPALVFHAQLIRANIDRALELAGGPARLRPHVKTHKTREIVSMLLDAGVTAHKCATIAEAELLASTGAPDVLIAYQLVGPNIGSLIRLIRTFPDTRFSTIVDHEHAVHALSECLDAEGVSVGVLLDLDVGQHRSGIPMGDSDAALSLYLLAARLPSLVPSGFHVYDGHNNQSDVAVRERNVREILATVLALRARAEAKGVEVPRLVCGGTPSFPVYARMTDVNGIECSPGTIVLHDAGYGSQYPDLVGVTPAAVLMTRVVSLPAPNRITLDLGTKAVASDPRMRSRVALLDFPKYETVGHNEEHLIVEIEAGIEAASLYKPGDLVYALPGHICPTVALHKEALVADGHKITGRWTIAARDRTLTV